jgi:hypothetical protein
VSLRTDASYYTAAHLAFHRKACTGGADLFGSEYDRLERAYERLTHKRPLVRWIIGHRWGMRMLLAWTS